jgi:catechol 2,3-dioxygenase-like lactoylglutathione lyase family enzyme
VTERKLACLALVVRDYDEALHFYTQVMRFRVVEDTPMSASKRWVVVAPGGDNDTTLLLAKAATPEQQAVIGNQSGGRVFLFLHTSDFDADLVHLQARGVRFAEDAPRSEAYGRVIVFYDLYGNKWDLIESHAGKAA